MAYTVISGKITAYFSTLYKAQQYARKFEFAQILDSIGIVRFLSRNNKIERI